jgi:hypothetical protein
VIHDGQLGSAHAAIAYMLYHLVKVAFVNQGYTGEQLPVDGQARGIETHSRDNRHQRTC